MLSLPCCDDGRTLSLEACFMKGGLPTPVHSALAAYTLGPNTLINNRQRLKLPIWEAGERRMSETPHFSSIPNTTLDRHLKGKINLEI